jgi:chitodextrinase
VGTGGANHTSLASTAAHSEVRNASTYGVLKVTLHPTSYDWQFVQEAGQPFTDSGTTACHGPNSDTVPPTAPSGLGATAVNGGRVDLTWTASSDNVAVAGYRVFRNGVQIGATTATTYSDTTAVPSTSYTYHVVAYDTSGNVSSPSNTVTVQTPADTLPPTTPSGLVASAVGPAEVDLTWSPSTDDVGVAGYEILRDGVQIGTSSTASYADLTTRSSTTYSYTVRAYDVVGNRSGESTAANVTTPAAPTVLTFRPAADTFVQSDTPGTNYGANTAIGTDNSPIKRMLLKFAVTGIEGRQILSAKLRLRCVNASGVGGAFHRVANTSWTEGGVTWNNAPPGDSATLGQLGSVSIGTWYEVDVTQLVSGDGTFSLDATSTSSDGADYTSKEGAVGSLPELVVTTSSTLSDTIAPTVPTDLTATATGAGRVDLSWAPSTDDVGVTGYNIFRNGAQVGSSTTPSFADSTALPQTSYSYAVSAFDASGNTSALSDPAAVTTPADTTAPSVPANLTATAAGSNQVNLAWTGSTDDVAVSGYEVSRDGIAVGTSPTPSFADTSAQPSTTYTYTVAALDAAGNRSQESNSATATTPAAAATLTFAPVADSYIQSAVPASNFGSATTVQVYGSPVQDGLLKFTVSGVGSRQVTSATLRLNCVDASNLGGQFRRVLDTSWTENGVTWGNAPAAEATVFGSLGSVSAGLWYTVPVPFITGDGTYSIRFSSTSTNGADFSSKEGANPPQLIVNTG